MVVRGIVGCKQNRHVYRINYFLEINIGDTVIYQPCYIAFLSATMKSGRATHNSFCDHAIQRRYGKKIVTVQKVDTRRLLSVCERHGSLRHDLENISVR